MSDATKSGSKARPTTTPEAIASETWYSAQYSHGRAELEAVQVERSTEKFVWVNWRDNGRFEQRAKVGDYTRYFPNYEDAARYIAQRFKADINIHKDTLEKLDKDFSKFYALWSEGKCTS